MTREDIIRMAREAGFDDFFCRDLMLERFAALVAAAEREACIRDVRSYGGIHIYDAGKIVEAIRARGSKFPTGASAAASGEDRHKIARAGHDSLMREIRDALRRTDPAWCAVNGVEQISDEELEELIARVEDAVEDGE